jgi:hypothetical protein
MPKLNTKEPNFKLDEKVGKKTESLNLGRDIRKLWKLVKQLNDGGTERNTKIALKKDGHILTGKQAADHFADTFAEDSDIVIDTERLREVCKTRQNSEQEKNIPEIMESLITLRELELPMSKLKMRKSPGADGVSIQ